MGLLRGSLTSLTSGTRDSGSYMEYRRYASPTTKTGMSPAPVNTALLNAPDINDAIGRSFFFLRSFVCFPLRRTSFSPEWENDYDVGFVTNLSSAAGTDENAYSYNGRRPSTAVFMADFRRGVVASIIFVYGRRGREERRDGDRPKREYGTAAMPLPLPPPSLRDTNAAAFFYTNRYSRVLGETR